MTKFPTWFSALVVASLACGGSSNNPGPPPDPTELTFQTAEGTLSSIGWTGVFHNIKGDSNASFGAKVTSCDNGVCQFEGPIDPVGPVNRRRCLYRTSMQCTVDSDCPLDSNSQPTSCVYIYDSPVSIPLIGGGKVGACALTYIPVLGSDHESTIEGRLNMVSGELDIAKLTVLLMLNGQAPNGQPNGLFQGVCPVCVGDTTPNDGKKDGTCQMSAVPNPMTGQIDPGVSTDVKCDVNQYGGITGYSFGYSMDCSPTLSPNIVATPFGGSFSSSGYKVSITDDSPKCTAANFMAANCFCGTCNDGSGRVCQGDAACGNNVSCVAASLPGDQSNTLNVPVAGNFCDGGVCNWSDAEGAGTCPSSLLGRTTGCYPSSSNGSLDSMGNEVGISVPGRAEVDHGVYYADTASAFCTPAGGNAGVNKQVGLPGLTFQKRNFRIIPTYPEDQK